MRHTLWVLALLCVVGCRGWERFDDKDGLLWYREVRDDGVRVKVRNIRAEPMLASLQGILGTEQAVFRKSSFLEPGEERILASLATSAGWEADWDYLGQPVPELPASLQGVWYDSGLAGYFDGPELAQASAFRLAIEGQPATGIIDLQQRAEDGNEIWGVVLDDERHYLLVRTPQEHCDNYFELARLDSARGVRVPLAFVTIADSAAANARYLPPIPRPPYGWWETVDPGDNAVFEQITYSTVWGKRVERVQAIVEERNQWMLELYHEPWSERNPGHMNARSHLFFPEGTIAEARGRQRVEAAGRVWDCVIYSVWIPGPDGAADGRVWVCPDLPHCFNNGAVKSELIYKDRGESVDRELIELSWTP